MTNQHPVFGIPSGGCSGGNGRKTDLAEDVVSVVRRSGQLVRVTQGRLGALIANARATGSPMIVLPHLRAEIQASTCRSRMARGSEPAPPRRLWKRSEERRVGKEGVSRCSSRWAQVN